MIEVGKMIATIRKDRKITQQQLADRIKTTKQTISNYERGAREPDYYTLEAIADVLNVPMSMLISRQEQRKALNSIYSEYNVKPEQTTPVRIPVLGSIPAGIPLEEIESIGDWEEIPADWTRGGKQYFALEIHGESMMPRYEDGDVVIFRCQETCESGQDCAVSVNGDEATFKRVRLLDNGMMLQALNPAYDSYVYSAQQIAEMPVKIRGVAVELRRKF